MMRQLFGSGPQCSGPAPRQSIQGEALTSVGSISSPARRRNSATSTTLCATPSISPSTRTRRPPVGEGGCTVTRLGPEVSSPGSSGACGPAFLYVIRSAAGGHRLPSRPGAAVPATRRGWDAVVANRGGRAPEQTVDADAAAARCDRAWQRAGGRWRSTPAVLGRDRRGTVAWRNSIMCSIFCASRHHRRPWVQVARPSWDGSGAMRAEGACSCSRRRTSRWTTARRTASATRCRDPTRCTPR